MLTAHNTTQSKGWHITLWLLQVLLAIAFGMAGFMKLTTPIADLAKMLPWAADVSEGMVRFIGASELAGALGLILPALTRIRPSLTPLAAGGLALIMVLAAGFHITRGETPAVGFNLALAFVAGVIAWGRTKKAPISPKA